MTVIDLHKGELAGFNFNAPRLDLTLRNVAVNGQWITGDAEVKASALGQDLDKTIPFKTLNNVQTDFDVFGIATLSLTVRLDSPNRVCASGDLKWGPFNASVGEQCENF